MVLSRRNHSAPWLSGVGDVADEVSEAEWASEKMSVAKIELPANWKFEEITRSRLASAHRVGGGRRSAPACPPIAHHIVVALACAHAGLSRMARHGRAPPALRWPSPAEVVRQARTWSTSHVGANQLTILYIKYGPY